MGAIQSIFFQPTRGYRKYTGASTGIGSINKAKTEVEDTLYQLDGVISEQHSSTATVTKHPVEYGVSLTDYIIKQPMKVIVDGVVTNSPFIKQMFNKLPGDGEFNNPITGAGETFTGDRIRNAYQGLIKLQNELLPLRLQTGLLEYDNMILTGISAPNDKKGNLMVKLTFEEIFIVSGSDTGATQAVTVNPTDLDVQTAITALAGIGITATTLGLASL